MGILKRHHNSFFAVMTNVIWNLSKLIPELSTKKNLFLQYPVVINTIHFKSDTIKPTFKAFHVRNISVAFLQNNLPVKAIEIPSVSRMISSRLNVFLWRYSFQICEQTIVASCRMQRVRKHFELELMHFYVDSHRVGTRYICNTVNERVTHLGKEFLSTKFSGRVTNILPLDIFKMSAISYTFTLRLLKAICRLFRYSLLQSPYASVACRQSNQYRYQLFSTEKSCRNTFQISAKVQRYLLLIEINVFLINPSISKCFVGLKVTKIASLEHCNSPTSGEMTWNFGRRCLRDINIFYVFKDIWN